MATLNRSQIFEAEDRKPSLTRVHVPEWGGDVFVRVMTGAERDAFEGYFETCRHKNLRAYLAVCVCCDEHGKDIFQADDLEALGAKSSAALDRIFPVALRVNRLRKKDIEELEGNSDASPSGGSRTDSRRALA